MKKILCVLVICFFSGCAVSDVLYLTPGKFLAPALGDGAKASLVLQPFSEVFSKNAVVGEHYVGKGKQLFKVQSSLVSKALDAMLGDLLIERGVTFAREDLWDLSLAGLKTISDGNKVVGGKITGFSVYGRTGPTRLTTQLELSIDVDCLVADSSAAKITRKSVHITEKVLKVSASQKDIENVIDIFLASAAKQIMINIEEFIR